MAIVATNLKRGQAVKYNGETGLVTNIEHRTPGKGNALIMATIRSFQTGKTKDIRFASSDKVDIVPTERQKVEFSYSDPSGYHFMDTNTYETVTLGDDLIGESRDLLVENLEVEILYCDSRPVSIDFPSSIEMEVTESSEGVKGDTANNPTKAVTLETGKVVQVPLFIKQGDRVKIDSETGRYTGRA